MVNRAEFAQQIAKLHLTHVERAIALLWFYRETQAYDERSPRELANDLHDEHFPKPNISRFTTQLRKSRYTIAGKRRGTVQIDVRRIGKLTEKYNRYLGSVKVEVKGAYLPNEWTVGTRKYLEQLSLQINGCYEYGFFDGCAALCRRLMESLIIECYFHIEQIPRIQVDRKIRPLDQLITTISSDAQITLGRNTPKTMKEIKTIGDTASHDRAYLTTKIDLDDVRIRFRHMIHDLFIQAGIIPS